MYSVGQKVVHPDNEEDAAIFAGFGEDGQETWCDIGVSPWGQEVLLSPETKKLIGFGSRGLMWEMSHEDFAASVVNEAPSDVH
jgi:hypothetical protein